MKTLNNLLQKIEANIPKFDLINSTVSTSSVGWHIEHSLITIDIIAGAIRKSDPKDYEWKFNFKRAYIFTLKKIPRGRATAPIIAQPKAVFNAESLLKHMHETKQKIAALHTLQSNQFFVHPFFGKLNLKQTIKFLSIHTNHHLHIITDIVNNRS